MGVYNHVAHLLGVEVRLPQLVNTIIPVVVLGGAYDLNQLQEISELLVQLKLVIREQLIVSAQLIREQFQYRLHLRPEDGGSTQRLINLYKSCVCIFT